jgi:putative membrane protein
VQAWLGWYTTERQLRLAKPLHPARIAIPVAVVVVVAGVLVLLALILR